MIIEIERLRFTGLSGPSTLAAIPLAPDQIAEAEHEWSTEHNADQEPGSTTWYLAQLLTLRLAELVGGPEFAQALNPGIWAPDVDKLDA